MTSYIHTHRHAHKHTFKQTWKKWKREWMCDRMRSNWDDVNISSHRIFSQNRTYVIITNVLLIIQNCATSYKISIIIILHKPPRSKSAIKPFYIDIIISHSSHIFSPTTRTTKSTYPLIFLLFLSLYIRHHLTIVYLIPLSNLTNQCNSTFTFTL